jgi:hypothetical protein
MPNVGVVNGKSEYSTIILFGRGNNDSLMQLRESKNYLARIRFANLRYAGNDAYPVDANLQSGIVIIKVEERLR